MAAGIAYFLVSDSDANQAPGGRLPGDSSVSPTPTESPSPTTEPPPELNNTGNDFEAIWRSMVEFRNWFYAVDPDPRWLARIYEPSCKCYGGEVRLLNVLDRRGWRYDDQGERLLNVELLQRTAPDLVAIEVTDRHGPQVIVNESGEVVRRGAGWPPERRVIGLHRGGDGRWRVVTIENLDKHQ
jgi:hypothetical protein